MTDVKQEVDRGRRFKFVAAIVAFCLITSGIFTWASPVTIVAGASVAGPLTSLYVSGMMSLATALSLGYITGSVIDYNGGIGNMISRSPTPRYNTSYDSAEG